MKVLFGKYPWNFKTEDIKIILNETQNKSRSHDLTLIVDTAPFYHCCKPRELINFEKTFETNFLHLNWKGICLYNDSDMCHVLPVERKELLKKYHENEFAADEGSA